jgi:hypothetical protein
MFVNRNVLIWINFYSNRGAGRCPINTNRKKGIVLLDACRDRHKFSESIIIIWTSLLFFKFIFIRLLVRLLVIVINNNNLKNEWSLIGKSIFIDKCYQVLQSDLNYYEKTLNKCTEWRRHPIFQVHLHILTFIGRECCRNARSNPLIKSLCSYRLFTAYWDELGFTYINALGGYANK